MKKLLFICSLILLSSCSASPVADKSNSETEAEMIAAIESGQMQTNIYENTKYGYSFAYPMNVEPWSALDAENEVIIPADSEDVTVSIASNVDTLLFQTDAHPILTFEVIESDENLEVLASEAVGGLQMSESNEITVDGNRALEYFGEENLSSKYRILVIEQDYGVLVVYQGADRETFNISVATLSFE